MSKVSDKILKRVYILFGAVALFSLIIVFRVVQIQFLQKEKWTEAVERERVYERRIPAARGNILADNGEVLATSQPFFKLPIDPTLIDTLATGFHARFDTLCKNLAGRFGTVDRNEKYFHNRIMKAIRDQDRHLYLVHEKVMYDDYREIRNWPILRNSKYEGGLIEDKRNNTRFYPYDGLARISLGVMMHDTIPLKGLEFAFHKYLRGVEGVALVQRISGGDEMPLETYREDEDGADIATTINVEMQDIVERELQHSVNKHNAKYGVAILMEVATGEIKAIANYPEVQNHAVATRIEPGSTFKLASYLALLEDRKIRLTDSIDTGKGMFMFYDKAMRDHLEFGKMSYRDAFVHSSNIAISKAVHEAYGKRVERWFARLEKFGLSEKVMPQEHIVGEPRPIIVRPGHKDWSGTTLPWMAIGYNSQLTPMQILAFYNAVANGGKLMEPTFVKSVRRGAAVLRKFEPKVLNPRIASEENIRQVQKLLEGVVEDGTGRKLKIAECKLAGKTGTARKYSDSLGYYERVYQASFCGYFPAENPRYSCYVVIDEPSEGEFYGANVAGPVFSGIARQVYIADKAMVPYFRADLGRQTHKPLTRYVHQGNAGAVYRKLDINAPGEAEATYVRTRENAGKIEFSPMDLKPGKIPNVRGMSARDAVALMEGLGMRVRLKGHGKVDKQSIEAGAPIEPRKTIELVLNK